MGSSATGAKPSGSIQLLGKFLEGHNSGEQVPKRSKGEKGSKSTQPYETILNQLSSNRWRGKPGRISRWFKCISRLIIVK